MVNSDTYGKLISDTFYKSNNGLLDIRD